MSSTVVIRGAQYNLWVIVYIALAHIGFFIGISYAFVHHIPWQTWVMAFLLWLACHLSITAGNHRLYSHNSYEAHPWLQAAYVVISPAAGQGPTRWWAKLHIIHHKHTDEVGKDPYTVLEGFWHAHMWWMCKTGWREILQQYGKEAILNTGLLRWQRKYYVLLALGMGIALPTLLGWTWGNPVGGFVAGFLIRLAPQLHFTWSVNSLAHWFGWKPYDNTISATDNPLLAPATVGESNHNRHHAAPYDHRLGVCWWNMDIGAWFLKLCWFAGLAGNLKRAEPDESGRLRPARPVPWRYRRA